MKMTNREMIESYNGLELFQKKEKDYRESCGENLLKGRVKISYAVERNKEELRRQLTSYEKTLEEIIKEYRNTEAEQSAFQAERENAESEGRAARDISIIMKDGKYREEYLQKLSELQEIEVEVEGIHSVDVSEFDGLNLDSSDLRVFLFMLKG